MRSTSSGHVRWHAGPSGVPLLDDLPRRPVGQVLERFHEPPSALPVNVLVPRIEGIDRRLRDGDWITDLTCEIDGPGDLLAQDGRLHRCSGACADGEDAVITHQDGAGAVPGQGVDDAAS